MMNDNKKNLCFVVPQLRIGGNGKTVSMLSKIAEKYYNVTVVVFDSEDMSYDYGGTLISLKLPPAKSYAGKAVVSVKRLIALKKIIKTRKIDILYLFTSHRCTLSTARYKDTYKITSCRDSAALAANPQRYGKMLTSSDRMIFNSQYMMSYMLGLQPESRDKCRVLQNTVDTQKIEKLIAEKPDDEFMKFISGKKTVVSCGRLCIEKGFEHLIRAFAEVKKSKPDAGLVLIGEGAFEAGLRSLAASLGIENDVYFALYQANPFKYMAHCDLYVLSSTSEGFPNVMLEAMACGLPVVASNIKSGPNEILKNEADYSEVIDDTLLAEYGILTPALERDGSFEMRAVSAAENKLAEAVSLLLSDEKLRSDYAVKAKSRTSFFAAENADERFLSALRD